MSYVVLTPKQGASGSNNDAPPRNGYVARQIPRSDGTGNMKRILVTMIGALVVFATCSCQANQPTIGHGTSLIPASTAKDLVTYADHLVILTVIKEERLPKDAEELKRSEGIIGRRVTADVSSPLWSRKKSMAESPKSFQMVNGGWLFHGDKEEVFKIEGQIDMSVGRSYLAALTYTSMSADKAATKSWHALQVLRLENERGVAEITSEFDDEIWSEWSGLSADEAGQVLTDTPDDPKAEGLESLDPVARYWKIIGFDPDSER